MKKLQHVTVGLVLVLCSALAIGDHLPTPTGPIILTVSGAITHTNNGDVAEFDRAMLQGLEQRQYETKNPWFDGLNTYDGPLGEAVMEAVGAHGESLELIALNDYSTDLPRSDMVEFGVLFATHINGQQLSVRDRGPLFVIYPFTDIPSLNSELYHSRSVWQLSRIVVHE